MRFTDGADLNQTNLRKLAQGIPASYTVWLDGGTYTAESNCSSLSDYSDSDVSVLLESFVLPALTGGGLVFFREGTFTFASTLDVVTSWVSFVGAGACTKFKLGTNANTEILRFGDGVTVIYGGLVSNIFFDGNNANNVSGTGVRFYGVEEGVVENCRFADFDSYGIHLAGSAAANTKFSWVFNNKVTNCTDVGIYAQNYSYDDFIYMNDVERGSSHGISLEGVSESSVIGNSVWENLHGINTYGSSHLRVTNNFITDSQRNGIILQHCHDVVCTDNYVNGCSDEANNTYDGIMVTAAGGETTDRVDVSHNIIDGDNSQRYGISESGAGNLTNNQITNNVIKNCVTATIAYANAKVKFNGGYVTENYGVTGAIATGTAVNHGCSATPTSVTITAAESGPTDIYLTELGAASFKINFGGGGNKTFYWKAEV